MTLAPFSVRQRLNTPFRYANTWLIIATLALAGWTADAIRMLLGMHDTRWPGLAAFGSHFWYVVPLAFVLFALTRLRQPAQLLGLALYDQAGRLMQRQGDVDLDDLMIISLRSALPDQQGLRSVQLPSGNCLYVVRERGLTMLLCFSGTASVRDVTGHTHWLHDDMPTFDLLSGLAPPVAAVASSLLASPVKRAVLTFFREHDHLAIGPHDLAYRVGHDPAEVAQALNDFVASGLLRYQTACDHTFYQLQRTPDVVALLNGVFDWRDRWRTHLQRFERMID